jgi:hypothetical protein
MVVSGESPFFKKKISSTVTFLCYEALWDFFYKELTKALRKTQLSDGHHRLIPSFSKIF